MNDTHPEIAQILFEKMMARSGSERVLMGFSMRQSAVEIVLSSLPNHLPPLEKKLALLERLYSSDFDSSTLEKIKHWIRNNETTAL